MMLHHGEEEIEEMMNHLVKITCYDGDQFICDITDYNYPFDTEDEQYWLDVEIVKTIKTKRLMNKINSESSDVIYNCIIIA